jgi:hypothetical protein
MMCRTMAVADEMEGRRGGKKMIENPVNVFGGEKGIKLRESKKNKK